jgi:hypothetical protein
LIAPLKQAEEGKVLESAQEFKSLLGLWYTKLNFPKKL